MMMGVGKQEEKWNKVMILKIIENSLAVQWLELHASTAGDMDLIPGWGTKIPQAAWHGQKKKKKN